MESDTISEIEQLLASGDSVEVWEVPSVDFLKVPSFTIAYAVVANVGELGKQ